MQPWIIYGGDVLLGCIMGGGSCLGGVWLYGQLDEVKHWSKAADALFKSAIYMLAVALAGACGWYYGAHSAAMVHQGTIGALWGMAGGVLGCAGLFRRVQAAAAGVLERRAGKL